MTDDIDRAQDAEALFREDALARSKAKAASDSARRRTRERGECEDCAAAIPPARLAVVPAARRCWGCQNRFEFERQR